MLVNFDRKVCYLAHPKTASQTTALTLRKHSGFVPVTDHHHAWDVTYEGCNLEDMGLDPEAVGRWREEWPDEYLYIFVIRNPWDTIASWWELSKAHIRHDRIGQEWFEDWKRLNPQQFPETDLWPFLHREPPGPTGVIHYEALQCGFAWISELLRFPAPGHLPQVGATKGRKPYPTYFDSESRKWVETTFPIAIEAGSYTFE